MGSQALTGELSSETDQTRPNQTRPPASEHHKMIALLLPLLLLTACCTAMPQQKAENDLRGPVAVISNQQDDITLSYEIDQTDEDDNSAIDMAGTRGTPSSPSSTSSPSSPSSTSSPSGRLETVKCPGTVDSVLFVCELSICQISCSDGTDRTVDCEGRGPSVSSYGDGEGNTLVTVGCGLGERRAGSLTESGQENTGTSGDTLTCNGSSSSKCGETACQISCSDGTNRTVDCHGKYPQVSSTAGDHGDWVIEVVCGETPPVTSPCFPFCHKPFGDFFGDEEDYEEYYENNEEYYENYEEYSDYDYGHESGSISVINCFGGSCTHRMEQGSGQSSLIN